MVMLCVVTFRRLYVFVWGLIFDAKRCHFVRSECSTDEPAAQELQLEVLSAVRKIVYTTANILVISDFHSKEYCENQIPTFSKKKKCGVVWEQKFHVWICGELSSEVTFQLKRFNCVLR